MSRIVGLACIVALLLGCDSGEEASEPETAPPAPAGSSTAVEPVEDEADALPKVQPMPSESTTIPSSFPSDVSLGEGTVPVSVREGARGFSVSMTSETPAEALLEGYLADFESKGWTIENQATMGDETLVLASKDGRGVAVMIKDLGDSRQVELATTDAPE